MVDRIFVYVESQGPACGAWIDLSDEEKTAADIAALAKGRDSAVSDVEGPLARAFYCASVDSFDFEGYWETDQDVTIHDIEPAAAAAWLANGNSWNLSEFQDHYQGKFRCFLDFVEDYIESTSMLSDVPDHIARYFDTEKFADDMGHDYWDAPSENGGVYVFRY